MSFKTDIRNVIETLPQWQDIIAEPIYMPDDFIHRKNAMRCYEINAEVARALGKQENMEVLLVGAHYPKSNAGCENYYVLARSRGTGEVMLVDAVVNSLDETMHEPFIATFDDARNFMKAHPYKNWDALWNLQHIVVHAPEVDLQKRNAFRRRWGEIGENFVFDVPQKHVGPVNEGSVLDTGPFPTGNRMTLEDMNRYAAAHNIAGVNFIGTTRREVFEEKKPAPQKMTLEEQKKELIAAAVEDRPEKREAAIEKIGELLSPDNPLRDQLANTVDEDNLFKPTILHLATSRGNSRSAWLIMESGANIYAPDAYGQTAMHYAGKNTKKFIPDEAAEEVSGKAAIVRMLAEKDRELKGKHAKLINTQDIQHNTPAHIAADSGNFTAGLAMIEVGADVKNIKKGGYSATEVAQRMKRRSDDHARTAEIFECASKTLYGDAPSSFDDFKTAINQLLAAKSQAASANSRYP